jgi:transcriptional regulator with XRE-family HTH domain
VREWSLLVPDVEQEASKLDQEIGARLRSARRACGMSQAVLGEIVGVTLQQVQRYEVGENRISASALVLAARALNLSPLELLGPDASDVQGDQPVFGDGHAEALLRAYKEIGSSELRRIVRELALRLLEGEAQAASRPFGGWPL